MNDQNEPAQLRFLEETAIRLRQNGFTVEPIEDHHLPVCWEKGRLCRISGKGSVLYRQENVDSIRAQDALQVVIDTAKMTSEYMAILEYAPQLKATDLTGDYRILADFGDAVLAGHPTERGVQFVTWEWDFDRKGVHHGHYFQDDYDAAKRDFTVRSGLVQKDALFEPEQLAAATGIFKTRERKDIAGQIQQTEQEISHRMDALPSIVQAEGYPDVQTFTATYRKAEAVVSQHNRELAEWERKVQERQRPAVKERPPEPRSVRERLRRLQDEGKRQQPQPHRRAVDRDSR